MVELIENHLGENGSDAKIAITGALAYDDAYGVGQELMKRLGCVDPLVNDLGPVIGTHTGPGVIGVAAYGGLQ